MIYIISYAWAEIDKSRMREKALPMVVEFEGGPCPSSWDAESATLMSLDKVQTSDGTVMEYSHTSVTQDVFLSTIIVVAEL